MANLDVSGFIQAVIFFLLFFGRDKLVCFLSVASWSNACDLKRDNIYLQSRSWVRRASRGRDSAEERDLMLNVFGYVVVIRILLLRIFFNRTPCSLCKLYIIFHLF